MKEDNERTWSTILTRRWNAPPGNRSQHGRTNDWSNSYANIKVEESDVAMVRDLIERTHYPYSTNVTIQEIVLDELEKYFNGRESAQEAARYIESRVKIYLGEQM